jgi:ureidoacrylate peracid hydrolase
MAKLASPETTALLLIDLQNDFLNPEGAYGRAGVTADAIAALPERLAPIVDAARQKKMAIISTHFTLVPDRSGAPIIAPHLKELRPFLAKRDFESGAWGHQLVDELAPATTAVEKVAYSAFYMSRLEWVLVQLGISHLIACGIVTNGGVASTVRDGHVRGYSMIVLEDGCAAFDLATHQTAIDSLRSIADISSCEDVLGSLKGLVCDDRH